MFNKNDFINWNVEAKRRNPENIDYISSSSNPMKQIRKVENIENINEEIEELDEILGLAVRGAMGLGRLALGAGRVAKVAGAGMGKAAGRVLSKVKGLGRGGSRGASKGAESAQTSQQVATRATDVAKLPGRTPVSTAVKPFGQRATQAQKLQHRANLAAAKAAKRQAAKVAAQRVAKKKAADIAKKKLYSGKSSKDIPLRTGSVSKVVKPKPTTRTTTATTQTAPTTAAGTGGGVKGAIDTAKTRLTKWSANQNKLGDRIVKGIARKGARFARTKLGKVLIGGAIAKHALSSAAESSRKKTWYPGMPQESTNYHGNERLDELISVLGREGMSRNRAYLGGLRDAYTGAKARNTEMKRKIVNWDRMGRDSKSRYSDETPSTAPKQPAKPKLSAGERFRAQMNKVKNTMKAAKKGILSRKVFDNTGGI